MTQVKVIACVAALLATLSGCALAASSEPNRAISVSVTVTTEEGQLPNGYLLQLSDGDRRYAAPVDAQGRSQFDCEFPSECQTIQLSLAWLPISDDELVVPVPVSATDRARAATLAGREFSLPVVHSIALQAGVSSYSVSVFVPKAVKVRGRTINAQGLPVLGIVYRTGTPGYMMANLGEGRFEVLGVRRAFDSWLFASSRDSDVFTVVPLSAAQTATDSDIGDIALVQAPADAPVDVVLTSVENVRSDLGLQQRYITYVQQSAGTVVDVKVNNSRARKTGWNVPPSIPAGRSYVVPGQFTSSDSVHKVLRLLAAGREADLIAAGVPFVDAVSGQAVEKTVDLAAAQAAIDGIVE